MDAERTMVLANARAIVARIQGKADDRITATQARALARQLDKLAERKNAEKKS